MFDGTPLDQALKTLEQAGRKVVRSRTLGRWLVDGIEYEIGELLALARSVRQRER